MGSEFVFISWRSWLSSGVPGNQVLFLSLPAIGYCLVFSSVSPEARTVILSFFPNVPEKQADAKEETRLLVSLVWFLSIGFCILGWSMLVR